MHEPSNRADRVRKIQEERRRLDQKHAANSVAFWRMLLVMCAIGGACWVGVYFLVAKVIL